MAVPVSIARPLKPLLALAFVAVAQGVLAQGAPPQLRSPWGPAPLPSQFVPLTPDSSPWKGPIPLPRLKPVVPPTPPWKLPAAPVPHSFRDAAGVDTDMSRMSSAPTECDKRLEKIAGIELLPRLIGPGSCGGADMVRVESVILKDGKRIEIKSPPHLQCPMAEQLAVWLRDEAVPRIASIGATLKTLETYESFECRGRNRKMTGKVSEHGRGNAVDLKGFTFADNRFVQLTDKLVPKEFRTAIKDSVCARFTTILGPGSDGYHEEHIHLDLAERRNGYRICQWNVLEPPPPPPPREDKKDGDKPPEPATSPPSQQQAQAKPSGEEGDDEPEHKAQPISGPVPLPKAKPFGLRAQQRLQRGIQYIRGR